MKRIEFDFFNVGGVQKIYAFPIVSFSQIREDTTTGHCFLELVSPDKIIEFYTIHDTVVFNEEESRSSAGVSYEITITGIIPKSCLPNRSQLQALENTPLFVLFIDNNDQIRLAGTAENQLTFTRKDTTGTLNTRNQIEFEIKGKQTNSCYFIDPQVFAYL